jgi:DNA polymerase I
MKLMRVTATDYIEEDGDVVVQLTGRDENNNRDTLLVEDTVPYFYVREDEVHQLDEDDDAVRFVERGYESFDDIPLAKVAVQTPQLTNEVEPSFTDTWESDIPFYRRVSIDGLSGHIRVPETDRCSIDDIDMDPDVPEGAQITPKVLIADIEVLQTGNTDYEEMMEEYNCPVSHISMWDSHADEYIALYLDPDGRVDTAEVSRHLDEHISAESLRSERERDIVLRSYETEESLLNGFLSAVEDRRPDLISGWNFVDFDWDYLLNRFEKFDELNEHRLSDIGWIKGYKTERKVDCLPAFDMMDAYCDKMTLAEWRSTALDYVSKSVLGVGKLPNMSITWAFDNAPNELLAYNIVDTMLCVALDRVEGVHEFFYELSDLSGVQIYDTFSEMRLIDGYIISQADDDEILPSMPDDQDIPENAGGLVLSPSNGVQEWVGVVDLKSLYPSSIITWNISPETIHWYDDESPDEFWDSTREYLNVPWLPDADDAEGGDFKESEIDTDVMWTDMTREGLIPKYLRRLFPERAERKATRDQYDPDDDLYEVWDRKQYAVKVIMNSFYGVMSNDWWRLGKYGLGDAVTSTARYALWQGKEIAQDEEYAVLYGDTDSIMVSLADSDEGKEVALERGHALESSVNSRMDECVQLSGMPDGATHPYLGEDLHGTDRHCLVYEFEKLYRRFFQAGSKKRYAGRIVWKEGKDVDGDIDMVGFESKRSDSPELTEEVQPEVINMILSGDGFQEVSDYVRGLIDDIEEREMELYKVALPKSLGQPLSEYGNTQTARACRFSNKHLDHDWSVGDDPWLYFIRSTPPMTPGADLIALDWDEELPEGFKLDLNETLDRACKGPLMPIFREVNWRWEEVKNGAKTQSAAEADWSVPDEDDEPDETEDDDEGRWDW